MFGCSRDPHRLGVERGGARNEDTTVLQYVARFDAVARLSGFGWGGYKENWPWCSLPVGLPSLFVAPIGE